MCTVAMRRMVEKEIASALIDDALAAGYEITVFDCEEFTLERSTDKEAILEAMFTTDDDRLFFYKKNAPIKPAPQGAFGWAWFVYGNDGYDVISDYTTNLDHIMVGAELVSKKYE